MKHVTNISFYALHKDKHSEKNCDPSLKIVDFVAI